MECILRSYKIFDLVFWVVAVPIMIVAMNHAPQALTMSIAMILVIGTHAWILWTRYISCNQWLATVPCDAPPAQRHIYLSRTSAAIAMALGVVFVYNANRYLLNPFLYWSITLMGIVMIVGHGQRFAFYRIDRPTYLQPCK